MAQLSCNTALLHLRQPQGAAPLCTRPYLPPASGSRSTPVSAGGAGRIRARVTAAYITGKYANADTGAQRREKCHLGTLGRGYSLVGAGWCGAEFGRETRGRGRGRRLRATAAAASGGEAVQGPPESREEAISQASSSLTDVLGKSHTWAEPVSFRPKARERRMRLEVDIPLLDDKPGTQLQLAADLLAELSRGRPALPHVALFFGDKQAAELAAGEVGQGGKFAGCEVGGLDGPARPSGKAGAIFLVRPGQSSMDRTRELVASAGMKPVIALNAGWHEAKKLDPGVQKFVDSFQVVYSFLPLAIQGFLSRSEGALVRYVKDGAFDDTPWLLYTKKEGKMVKTSTLKKRPNSEELETVLYQAGAATSPITRSIRVVQSLIGMKG